MVIFEAYVKPLISGLHDFNGLHLVCIFHMLPLAIEQLNNNNNIHKNTFSFTHFFSQKTKQVSQQMVQTHRLVVISNILCVSKYSPIQDKQLVFTALDNQGQ